MLLLSRAGFFQQHLLPAVCLFTAPVFIGASLRRLFSGYRELFLTEPSGTHRRRAPAARAAMRGRVAGSPGLSADGFAAHIRPCQMLCH